MRSLIAYVNNWQVVTAPIGMSINVPFTIERSGRQYRVDPDFNIRDRANITVSTTYYVDSVNGSDSNNGLTDSTPFATLTKVNSQGNADRIYIARGSEFQKNQRPLEFTRSIEFLTYGTGDKPRITSLINNQIGTFSQTSDYYSASAGDFVGKVVDISILDANGNPTQYTQASSIAEVDSTAGSYFWSSSVVYIRTLDDRPPDSDIMYYDNLCYRLRENNTTQYFEGIEFQWSAQFETNDATGGTKVYFKDCQFNGGNYQFWGLDECIIQNCNAFSYEGDVFNLDDKSGVTGNIYEVNCTVTNYQSGDTSSQCSTLHNTANAIRVGGVYTDAAGQVIGDTGTGQAWIMGMTLDNGGGDVTTFFSNTAWLERNDISGDTTSIQIAAGGVVNHLDNNLAGTVNNSGIYQAYTSDSVEGEGNLYATAAIANGYTGGNISCSQEIFTLLENIDTPGFEESSAYSTAALADSFTGGSVYCSELFFTKLENIFFF